jgi:hypothetical protein
MKWPILIFTVAVAAAGAQNAAPQAGLAPGQPAGQITDGLRLGIAAVGRGALPSKGAEFVVSIENAGASDFVVNLGHMLANGEVMLPAAIRLMVTDALGQTRELRFFDRRYPGVAGRVDDFTVALRSGSVYMLRISLDHYISPDAKESGLRMAGGRYRIAVRFEGRGAQTTNIGMEGAALLNFWTGTAQSNVIDVEVP